MPQLVMYLFGDRDPELAAVLRERSFQHLVAELFAAQELAAPVEPSPLWGDAVRLELLAAGHDGYRAGRRLVLIPAEAETGAAELLRCSPRYVEVAREAGARLRAVYGQTAAAERFTWSQVSHLVVAGLFLDLAMGAEVLRSGRISRKPAGDSVVWGFQGISAENPYGVSSVAASPPRRAFFAELWHRSTRRSQSRLSPSLVDVLLRIGQGEQVHESRELLYLKHLKLVRSAGGSLQLQMPAFGASDGERLLPPLMEGARRLVEEAIVPALERLQGHHWWRERMEQEAYRHAAVRLILEHGIDSVISAHVCDPFPEAGNAPAGWGRCLWEEPEGPRTVMPHVVSHQSEASSR